MKRSIKCDTQYDFTALKMYTLRKMLEVKKPNAENVNVRWWKLMTLIFTFLKGNVAGVVGRTKASPKMSVS